MELFSTSEKTNLLKKYKTAESQRWLRGEKTKIDRFNLHFTPKIYFLPDESTIPSKADWATSKNTVYQDFKKGKELIYITYLVIEK